MLNGKIVSLRELDAHDLEQLFLWNERAELYLFKGRYKFASQEDLKKNFIGYSYSQKIFIISKGQNPIGISSYWDEDHKNRTCEFYAKIYDKNIDPQLYLTETLNILTNFLFASKNLSRIYTCISDPNDLIKPVLEKLKFKKEGILREHRFVQGQYVDTQIYGQLASENKLEKIENR